MIGRILRDGLSEAFEPHPLSHEAADVTDLAGLERVFTGMDAVVHLAANASVGAPWEEVLPPNVIGAYNVYEAARRAGVKRVVFASSNHAMGMYVWDDERFADPDHPRLVGVDDPVRPDSIYGASKAWGEALGRMYAERHGLAVICLRIGWVTDDDQPPTSTGHRLEPPDVARRTPGMWLSHRDCLSLIEAALATDRTFAIVNGVSDNRGRWFSLDAGRELLGWVPQDGI